MDAQTDNSVGQRYFSGVADCVIWAEAQLLRDGAGSQLGKFIPRRGDSKDPAIRMTAEEVRDIAHTISCKVSHVKPHIAGTLYRFLCGASDMELAYQVSRDMGISIRAQISAPRTPITKLEALALSVMQAERRRKQFDQRTSVEKLAKRMGMTRDAMMKQPWADARLVAYKLTHEWVEVAERQLGTMLDEIGVL